MVQINLLGLILQQLIKRIRYSAYHQIMNKKYFQLILVILVWATGINVIYAQRLNLCNPSSANSFFLHSSTGYNAGYNWSLKKASEVRGKGDEISLGNYQMAGWLPAIVPGTVLTSLVANKVYPDPYFGDINRRSNHMIPDMADSGREFYHYWYRTNFKVPASFSKKRVWLKLHGINYKCTVWLNGKELGSLAGMFNTKAFDISFIAHFDQTNTLALDVDPVVVPGQSGPKKEKRNGAVGENSNGGDGEIGRNVTMLMSVGWDFTFPDGVRDRNTGIWRDIEIYTTDDVVLENPFIYSKLPLPDTLSARQTISVEAFNASSKPQTGLLKGMIKETGTAFEKQITLAAGERKTIVFDANDYPQLVIKHPKLWWPLNKGAQFLHHLQLSFMLHNQLSDVKTIRFGIREITSDQNTPDSSRRFFVNGQPIFIRGTNWVPEAMLRNTAKRTCAELQYTRQAGVNMLRLWGGGIAESDYFYDLCDELGLLVWNEYWLTGDTKFPEDTSLYLTNLESTIKRLRNHASLAYHVSSNESTEVSGAAVLFRSLDPSRGYQMQSECCGVHDGSPYKYENPMQYFENTASIRGNRIYGFNPEYGTLCLPIAESLKKMMPAKDLWPINESVWNYMDGGGFHQVTTKYRKAVEQFGSSASIDEFAKKAQFVGALNYRAIWEVWNYNKFNYGDRFTSGFLFWYNNSPVPQTSGRLYDWSLEPTAALYYSQNGLQPLHAQFDYLKNAVSVYNDYRKAFVGYSVVADVYDMNAQKVMSKEAVINIPADGVVNDILKIDFPAKISQVHFIKLTLKDKEGKKVSDSFYWRSKDKYEGAWTLTGPAVSGFQQINDLKKVDLVVSSKLSNDNLLTVNVANPSVTLSFFTQLKLQNDKGRSVSPAFYSDNFFSLLPGESKTVTIRFYKEDIKGEMLNLVIDGLNVNKQVKIYHIK